MKREVFYFLPVRKAKLSIEDHEDIVGALPLFKDPEAALKYCNRKYPVYEILGTKEDE